MTMSPDQRALLAISAVGYDTTACRYLLDSVADAIRAAVADAIATERREVVDADRGKGTNRTELTEVLTETLALLKHQSREMDTVEFTVLAGLMNTATMHARLVKLEGLGFVVSRRHGRRRLWKVVT